MAAFVKAAWLRLLLRPRSRASNPSKAGTEREKIEPRRTG